MMAPPIGELLGFGIVRIGAAGKVGRVADIPPVLVACLARELQSRRHLVLRDAGDELADKVGLIDEIGVVGLALAPLATIGEQIHRIIERKRGAVPTSGRPGSAWKRVVGEADVARCGHPREACVVDVARGIGELEVLVELMLDLFRDDVGVGLRDIAERPARDPEEIGAWDREWRRRPAVAVITWIGQEAGQGTECRLRKIGEAVIRHALLALIDVIQRGLGALLEVVDHGRRDAPALGPDLVAGRGVDVLEESLDAAGHVAALAAGVDHLAVAVARHHRRGRTRGSSRRSAVW